MCFVSVGGCACRGQKEDQGTLGPVVIAGSCEL